ncbi:hypothetical protein [Halosegnis marinus]|uniref:Uncharacterized protein n=1 Tax=Halosegnis marinus TaxID=3034023 RepID=A0ABD5ZRX7_9EURY|nr:hypothetical protein [Halosegnis sp. DT85]
MDVASPIASRLAGQTNLSSGNSTKTAMFGFAARFAFDWLGGRLASALGYRDADHPPATGYRQHP